MDGGDEFLGLAVGASLEPFAGEFAEPAFDQVHPGAVGGSEMKGVARLSERSVLDCRSLMGGGVVHDHVHGQILRHLTIDQFEELDEFLGAVTGGEIDDHLFGSQTKDGLAYRLVVPKRR